MSDKEAAILAATLRLVSQHGFHGTSMAMIASAAGVSAGIIYHYFDNKDALLAALYRETKRRMGRALLAGYHDDAPLRARFERILLNIIDHYIAHPDETAYMEQFASSPYCTEILESEAMEGFAPVAQLIDYAMQEGILKPVPVEMVFAFTSDVAMALAKKHIAGTLDLNPERRERAAQMCWDALKA